MRKKLTKGTKGGLSKMQTETQDKMRKEVNAVEKEKQVVTQRSEQKVQLQNKKEVSNVENLKI